MTCNAFIKICLTVNLHSKALSTFLPFINISTLKLGLFVERVYWHIELLAEPFEEKACIAVCVKSSEDRVTALKVRDKGTQRARSICMPLGED